MNDRKLIGEWKGKLTINGTLKERKIQIFKVKNQKNKIVFPGFRGPEEGTLLAIKRKKPTLLGGPNGNLESVFVTYSARGSHQGGPMHTYNKHVALASKDEKVLESLMKFLQKHITKGKVRKTIKRGGGKKRKSKRSKKSRKAPEESATKFSVGTIKKENDGNLWQIHVYRNGVKRWVKNQKGGTLIGSSILGLPLDADGVQKRVFHDKKCTIYDMKDIENNLREHNYEYFLTDGDSTAINTIAENPTPASITKMLSQPFFRDKINEYIDGDIDKLIVLHVLKRDAESAAFFPNLHTDYDRDIGIGEGCIKMCEALKDDQNDYMVDVSYIQEQIGGTDDSKLYPLNLWSLLACNGGQLNNDNLCFYSLGNVALHGHKPKYSTSGVSYMLRTELPETLSLHTYDNLPADGSGYLFNSREIPHCSIHFPDRGDSNRTSIEIRIMVVKK